MLSFGMVGGGSAAAGRADTRLRETRSRMTIRFTDILLIAV